MTIQSRLQTAKQSNGSSQNSTLVLSLFNVRLAQDVNVSTLNTLFARSLAKNFAMTVMVCCAPVAWCLCSARRFTSGVTEDP